MKTINVRTLNIGSGMPKICVPIVGETSENIVNAARQIVDMSVDLVEWRVDYFQAAKQAEAVIMVAEKLREVLGDMPILFTFRTKNEGGEKAIEYEQYAELLCRIADAKLVDMIDVEVFLHEQSSELISTLQNKGIRVVGSNHDFDKTPPKEEIVRRLCCMQEKGVDIPKIAVMPQNSKDVLVLLDATAEMAEKHADRPIVTMSMSAIGTISRIAGETFGSAITFGCMGKASAPGQVQVEDLRKALQILNGAR